MRYQVLDTGKPANCFNYNVSKSWDQSTFDNFEDALAYANNWLGDVYGPVELKVNIPWGYSGYGDTIEIREVK